MLKFSLCDNRILGILTMKRILFVITICLFAVKLSAENSSRTYRAVYGFEYTKDSINSTKGYDILYLELYEDHSFCFSKYTWELDSIINSPHGEKLYDELLTASLLKDGPRAGTYPHRRSTFMVSKYPDSKSIITKDYCDNEYYQYCDSMADFVWNITDSIKIIDGMSVINAQGTYHGRLWNVWFCPDLPWSDGPWKFCNLPGLIIEARDKDELYVFKLLSLNECNHPMLDWCENAKRTRRKEFLNMRYKSLKNNLIKYRVELGIDNQTNMDTRYLDGLEPDFKQ